MRIDEPSGSGGDRRLLLVVGIGRSGTSLFAGIVRRLGFHVPQPEVKPDDTNPRGFGEPRWVVDFHKRLLRDRRVTLYDARPAAWEITAAAADETAVFRELRSWLEVQFVGVENVVVKDPRIGWFLPLWRRCADEIGAETSFATMLRYPPEAISSARTWYGTWQNDASRAAAWLNHTLETERTTRDAPRVFVRYQDLLDDWPREIARVGESLGLPWLVGLEPSGHPDVNGLLDPSLRRTTVDWDDVRIPPALQAMVDDVWQQATALAQPDGDTESRRAALDGARAAYAGFYADAEAITQSSVTALKRSGRGAARAGRAAGLSAASLPFALRIARRIPRRHRERVRLVARGGLGRRGLRLLVGAVLLIPPRYRERVPLPIVRAGLRMVRTLRR